MNVLGRARMVCFAATAKALRARAFYGEVLGLRMVEDTPFALVFDANGTTVDAVASAGYTVLGWQVDDIRSIAPALTGRGVQFRRYDGMDHDEDGIWASPGGALVAWFEDPDRNTISLTQAPAGR